MQLYQVEMQLEAVQFLEMSSKELDFYSTISKMFPRKLSNLLQGQKHLFICLFAIIVST